MPSERLSRRMRPRKRLKFLLFAQLSCSGCLSATPFQSARVVEPGHSAGTFSAQHTVPQASKRRPGYRAFEGGARIPLPDGHSDFGLSGGMVGYDGRHGKSSGPGGVFFGFGLKSELIDDVLAIELPGRMAFAGLATLHTTHFFPRVILSVPLGDHLEVNLSATKFFGGSAEHSGPWGYAAGLAIGRRGGTVLRPEIGVLDYADGNDMLQFGIALTPVSGTPRRTATDERTPH